MFQIGVCPIPDNKPEHHYLYEITVNTGSRLNAGTKSKVYINVIGNIIVHLFSSSVFNDEPKFVFELRRTFCLTLQSEGTIVFVRLKESSKNGSFEKELAVWILSILLNSVKNELLGYLSSLFGPNVLSTHMFLKVAISLF